MKNLQEQIYLAIALCSSSGFVQPNQCLEEALHLVQSFESALSKARQVMISDLEAAYDGDPAAKSHEEVLLSYPGFYAAVMYRIAHILENLRISLLPRMITEIAHQKTGIDIHPGAMIGERFFIDHGTGVVIGETTNIGKNVKLYQGVTLGALSIPSGELSEVKKIGKRHPTIEDRVTIYSGATILGGDTVIGKGSVIGGNAWIIHSLPEYSKVMNSPVGQKTNTVEQKENT